MPDNALLLRFVRVRRDVVFAVRCVVRRSFHPLFEQGLFELGVEIDHAHVGSTIHFWNTSGLMYDPRAIVGVFPSTSDTAVATSRRHLRNSVFVFGSDFRLAICSRAIALARRVRRSLALNSCPTRLLRS